MLVLRDRLLNVPIISLQTGMQLGTTSGVIIDPRRLNIVAFYCSGPRINFSPAVLYSSDIRELSDVGMIVNAAENIVQPAEQPRLQEIIDYRFQLEGKLVVEENGRRIGKVDSYTVETGAFYFYISKLHVRPSLIQSFAITEVLIDRSQILTIDNKRIIVRQAAVREEERVQPGMIDNPFRKPKPQAESVRTAQ